MQDKESKRTKFEEANEHSQAGFVSEFIEFLKENKKWWMAPILIVLGLLTLVAFFSSTAAAPFIYSLF